jgi:hydrogenase expression/formation protein HypD
MKKMKYIDEYRNSALAEGLIAAIGKAAYAIGNNVTIMEICGSHTTAIGRSGIRNLLPANIRLISGPGCPVCVTSIRDVDAALYLACTENVIFATFGDMLRVPGTGENSLQKRRAAGADVRVVFSAADCIALAEKNRQKDAIFMGIGFETTAPTIASVIQSCERKGIGNFFVFSVHKLVPPALKVLIEDPALNIDGFLCPGHVSTIIGADAYNLIPQAGKAAVITGFEPVDILEGILMILRQIQSGEKEVAIQYVRGVHKNGNPRAREVMESVFIGQDAEWRGLGIIPASGLQLREAYRDFDARAKYPIPELNSVEIKGCSCGDILRGVKTPVDCPLFKVYCTPANPVGPCMVSSEGTCAAYYKYR